MKRNIRSLLSIVFAVLLIGSPLTAAADPYCPAPHCQWQLEQCLADGGGDWCFIQFDWCARNSCA